MCLRIWQYKSFVEFGVGFFCLFVLLCFGTYEYLLSSYLCASTMRVWVSLLLTIYFYLIANVYYVYVCVAYLWWCELVSLENHNNVRIHVYVILSFALTHFSATAVSLCTHFFPFYGMQNFFPLLFPGSEIHLWLLSLVRFIFSLVAAPTHKSNGLLNKYLSCFLCVLGSSAKKYCRFNEEMTQEPLVEQSPNHPQEKKRAFLIPFYVNSYFGRKYLNK